MHNKKIKITTIILLIILTIPLSIAITTPITPINPTTNINEQNDLGTSEAIQNTIIREHLKTRQEIKTYTDGKITEMENTVKTDGQKFIDENFRILDQRMQDLATKFLIKIAIAIVACIIFANATWFYFKRLINRKEAKRPNTITADELNTKLHGIIHEEFAKKLEQEKKVEYKAPPAQEFNEKQPIPPTVEMITKQIEEQKKKQPENQQPKQEGIIKRLFKKKETENPKPTKQSAIKRLFKIKNKTTPTTNINEPTTTEEETQKPTKQITMKDVEKKEAEKFQQELEALNKMFEEMQKNTQKPDPNQETPTTKNNPEINLFNEDPTIEQQEQTKAITRQQKIDQLNKQIQQIEQKINELE
jgi:hypothetical protein